MAFAIPKITYGGFIPTTISFTYPPTDPSPEVPTADRKITQSLSGVRQVQFNSLSATNKLTFRWVSETLRTALTAFFESYAVYGKTFRYYDDASSSNYKTYEIDMDKLNFKPIAPVGTDVYIYEVELDMRRVVDTAVTEYIDMQIANNQVAAADVTGLALDSTQYRTVQLFYEIFRKTNSSERVANGWFKCLFHVSTGNWTIEPGEYEGDSHGVTFSVTNAGQVQYVSDNQAGTGYTSQLLIKDFRIAG